MKLIVGARAWACDQHAMNRTETVSRPIGLARWPNSILRSYVQSDVAWRAAAAVCMWWRGDNHIVTCSQSVKQCKLLKSRPIPKFTCTNWVCQPFRAQWRQMVTFRSVRCHLGLNYLLIGFIVRRLAKFDWVPLADLRLRSLAMK